VSSTTWIGTRRSPVFGDRVELGVLSIDDRLDEAVGRDGRFEDQPRGYRAALLLDGEVVPVAAAPVAERDLGIAEAESGELQVIPTLGEPGAQHEPVAGRVGVYAQYLINIVDDDVRGVLPGLAGLARRAWVRGRSVGTLGLE